MGGLSFSFTMALDASHFTLFCDYKFFFIFIDSMLGIFVVIVLPLRAGGVAWREGTGGHSF